MRRNVGTISLSSSTFWAGFPLQMRGFGMSNPAFVVMDLKTDTGQHISTIPVPTKEFKTGSRGYYANQKIEIGGKRYQMQVQLVEIGSKKTAENGAGESNLG